VSRVLIEAPDSAAASLLRERLQVETELVHRPGRCELRGADVRLAELPGLLAAIERWMIEVGIGSVALRLDERSYVLISGNGSPAAEAL
jgi:hypothetical protein